MRVASPILFHNKITFPYNAIVQVATVVKEGDSMAQQAHSLSHTKWLCKYHIVFAPKYRRKIIYNQYRQSVGEILRQLCKYKGVEIVEGHLMPDHVHMLVSIPPKISVSSFMGYLKGKSSLMMFDKHANLKYKFGNRKFWAEGYYVSIVGLLCFLTHSSPYVSNNPMCQVR
jgi:putative transposase